MDGHNEKDCELIAESLSIGMFRSKNGYFEFINPAGAKILGFDSPEEVINKRIKTVQLFFDPEEREKLLEILNKNGYIKRHIQKVRLLNGNIRWLNSAINVSKNKAGEITGYSGVFRDVSDEIELQNSLSTHMKTMDSLARISAIAISNDEYKKSFKFILKEVGTFTDSDLVCLIDSQNSQIFWSKGKYDFNNLDLKKVNFINDAFNSEKKINSTYVSDLSQNDRDLLNLEAGSIITLSISLSGKDSGLLMLYSCHQKNIPGDNLRMLETVSHIISQVFEKKQLLQSLSESEKKYKGLVENSNDGIFIVQDNIVKYVNDTLVKILGMKKGDIVGRNFLGLVNDCDRELFVDGEEKIKLCKIKYDKSEAKLIKNDGNLVPVELNRSSIIYNGRSAIQSSVRDLSEMKQLEKEKNKIMKNMGRRISLTSKEKLVFYNIARNSLYNDKQISDLIKVPLSTVSSIRNRLKKEGYFEEIIIPNFVSLGFNSLDMIIKNGIHSVVENDSLVQLSNICYSLDSRNSQVSFVLSNDKDKTSYDRSNAGSTYFEKKSRVHFPFSSSQFAKFFDFSEILARILHLDFEDRSKEHLVQKNSIVKFTKREKLVLYALCKYPGFNDTNIAKKIEIPRSTVSVIRNKLINEGIIRKSIVPSFDKINCELMTVVKYNLIKPVENTKLVTKNIPDSYLIAENENELVTLSLYKNYSVFKTSLQGIINLLYDNEIINSEPEILIIPVSSINQWHTDFSSLLKEKFDLDF